MKIINTNIEDSTGEELTAYLATSNNSYRGNILIYLTDSDMFLDEFTLDEYRTMLADATTHPVTRRFVINW